MFSWILQFGYVEVRISRSISESPLEFEITRVDCIMKSKCIFKQSTTFLLVQSVKHNRPYPISDPQRDYLTTKILNISVTLSADDNSPFKGFLVIAHRVEGDREKALGTYTNFPEDKAKTDYCIDDQDVSINKKNQKV